MGMEQMHTVEANETNHDIEIGQDVLSAKIDTRTDLHELLEETTENTDPPETEPEKEPRYWDVERANVLSVYDSDTLKKDPATPTAAQIDLNWITEMKDSGALDQLGSLRKQSSEMGLLVGRALYLNQMPVTKENVQNVLLGMVETQKAYEKIPLYKKRNVVVAFANETLQESMDDNFANRESEKTQKVRDKVAASGDAHTFGRNKYVENVVRQNPDTKVLRTEDSPEGSENMKNAIKESIVNTPPPFTFEWEGHGMEGDGGSILLKGIHNLDEKITADEIGEWLIERYEKYPALLDAEAEMQDIFIWKQCYNHTFLRTVYDTLTEKFGPGRTLPIEIGDSEIGMISVTNYGNEYGNSMTEAVVTDEVSTIGSATKTQKEMSKSFFLNTSVYTPIGKNASEKVGLPKGFILPISEQEAPKKAEEVRPGMVEMPYEEQTGTA
jgi:hypothetical protein